MIKSFRNSVRFLGGCSTLFILQACASPKTGYKTDEGTGGFSERRVNERVFVSRFTGNEFTPAAQAKLLSGFRAVEICAESKKIARIYETRDFTRTQTVQKTAIPTYQTLPLNSSNSSADSFYTYLGPGKLQSVQNTSTVGSLFGSETLGESNLWQDVYKYPRFDSVFSCVTYAPMLRVRFRPVAVDDMKLLVKDLMGAVQVTSIAEDSPNKGILQVGDIIVRVGTTRVEDETQLSLAVEDLNNPKIPVLLYRDGRDLSLVLNVKDETAALSAENERIIKNACTSGDADGRPICKKKEG